MFRNVGLMIVLALAAAACGGGGSGSTAPSLYTVGGTVTGLSGQGLVLYDGGDSGGEDLPIAASGGFTFATRLANGGNYVVSVKTAPTSPLQYCTVTNGAGTIAGGNVANVRVACQSGIPIGGTVSGLQGSGLVLQLVEPCYYSRCVSPVGAPLSINSNGPFAFVLPALGFASQYLGVRITQQPKTPAQYCVLHDPGIVAPSANYSGVQVVCAQFAYVANAADDTISVYTIDAASGALEGAGSPVYTRDSPQALVGTPDRRFVYVGGAGTHYILAYAVDPATGALTAVTGSPFAAGTNPRALAYFKIPSFVNGFLYVANQGSGTVSAYTVDPDSGTLAPLSPATFATGKGPSALAVDPAGPILYVANSGGSNDISAFSIDAAGGGLTPVAGSPFPAGANPQGLALGAGGKFLYAASPDSVNPGILGFSASAGVLKPLSGSPFPIAVSHGIAVDGAGAYLYATTVNGVVGYAIDPTTGALTALPGFPLVAGNDAWSMSFDFFNQFLYVTNAGSADVSAFGFDETTGGISPIAGAPFPAGNQPQLITTF